MLILSRRPSETIDFPQLGVSVSIVSVKGSRVQVGVDAPPEIKVLRRELDCASTGRSEAGTTSASLAPAQEHSALATHDFKNRLNKATLGLHLAQKQLAAGLIESADKTLAIALTRLAELETSVCEDAPPKRELSSSASGPRSSSRPVGQAGKNKDRSLVLLVEDDLNEQALLRSLLEMEGYEVHTASNGHEALACLQHLRPQFVLLDMMMPKCDGRETLQRIREVPALQDLPIFAVSGSSPTSLGLPIGGDGVDAWFPKPLNAPQLVQRLRDSVTGLCV